jgi:hypothetical protein
MMKKSEGKPRRLSVKKQAVKTGGEGGKRRRTDVDRIRWQPRIRQRPIPVESDVARIRQRPIPIKSDVARIRQRPIPVESDVAPIRERKRMIERERPPKAD